MPNGDDESAEWLGVIERQQQEIELLRQKLATSRGDEGSVSPLRYCLERRGSDVSSVASSAVSLAFSVLSLRDGDSTELPMDSDRYATICEKMERMRAALARKDAKLRKAQAQSSAGQKENAHLRDAMANLRSELETQRAQLARERAACQDAVDKAVETAAQALSRNDPLTAELSKLRELEAGLRQDIRVRSNAVKAADIAKEDLQKNIGKAQQEVSRLATDLRVAQQEKNILRSRLRGVQDELAAKRKSISEWSKLDAQRQALKQRVNELETIVQQQAVHLHQQTQLIDEQGHQIKHLKDDLVLAERAAAVERTEDQRHAAHLLKGNIALEHELECEQARGRTLQEQARGLSETSLMLGEDLLQAKLKVLRRDQVLQQRDEKYFELLNAYRGLGKHTQALELSERKLVSVLIPTKKRLVLLQDTLTRFCYELEGVTKQMIASRNREISVGRALREYGKRNRELQLSVVAARQQLRSLVGAFRSSEKRKEQAISANWSLKRDLVLERCQRTDLVRQCKELENCLDSCQTSAFETQARAEGLERDNGVLQHAVTQLVAYAKELMSSQQSLQRELTMLEITGKRSTAVYG